MIHSLIRTQFDTVVAMNKNGRKISKHCGVYEEVKEAALEDTSPETLFYHENHEGKLDTILKEDW